MNKNKLHVFLILYLIYNLTSMNFYNIIEDKYLEKKNLEFLKSRYYEYLLFIIGIGLIIASVNLVFYNNMYFRLIYIYMFLLICNCSLIEFYTLKLFKNYYKYNKKKNVNMDFRNIQYFLTANLYSFVIQNIYTEKEGNDYLSINAVSGVIDFFYYVVEFIFYDLVKNDTVLNIIDYLSFFISCGVGLFLLIIIFMLMFLFYSFLCGKCCNYCEYIDKKFKNFLRCIKII